MAYTKTCFDTDPATGHIAMYLVDPANKADDAPLFSPHNHLLRILVHSALDYQEACLDQTVSLTLPARGAPINNATWYVHGYNGVLAHAPFDQFPTGSNNLCLVLLNEAAMSGITTVQTATMNLYPGTRSIGRSIAPVIDGGTLKFLEAFDYNFLSASQTYPASAALTLRLIVFRNSVATRPPGIDIDPANGVVSFGGGKFDPVAKTYARAVPQQAGAIKLMSGRSIDMQATGYKQWYPDGTSRVVGTYTGTYAGPAAYWVDIA